MDNAQNEHGNNDDGSTTLTKMKNTSSVIQHKIQVITFKHVTTLCSKYILPTI